MKIEENFSTLAEESFLATTNVAVTSMSQSKLYPKKPKQLNQCIFTLSVGKAILSL